MNRIKVWIFTLLVVGAGAAALIFHAHGLREDMVAGLDARLAAGAGHASAALHASLREAAAAAAIAAREPSFRAALSPAVEAPPLPRKPRGKTSPPPRPGDPEREEAAFRAAAQAALVAAEGALGGELPAGRVAQGGNLASLSRKAIGGDADALVRGAAEGTARAGFARGDGRLWAAAGAPAGEGAGIVVLVPVGEAWARAVSTAAGVDATVVGTDVKPSGTAPATDLLAITGAAIRSPGKAVDVGVLPPMDVGTAALPVQLPKVGLLLGSAPAHRARAVPVEGLKGVSVVLSTPAAPALSRVVALQWRGLAALAGLLLVGLVFGFLVKPSEIVPAVPEHLVAAAARIERGDFSTRAPQFAGKLGTLAAALNRAAEAAEGAGGGGPRPTPSPGSITQDFFAPQVPPPPEAEPSAFDFPQRPPRQRPVEPERKPAAGLTGDPFQATPVPSRPTPIGNVATPAEVIQAAARSAPPPIPNATMTRTMPAVSGPDDEQSHWQQVFQDFVRMRAECGEPSEGLTFERFRQKLESNKATLVAKYQCKTVRFQVYVKEGKAALKATPVR